MGKKKLRLFNLFMVKSSFSLKELVKTSEPLHYYGTSVRCVKTLNNSDNKKTETRHYDGRGCSSAKPSEGKFVDCSNVRKFRKELFYSQVFVSIYR